MQAKMNNWNGWIDECRPDVLMAKYENLLLKSGFKIRNKSVEFFKPFGFTALFLLSESHFAIHTFPEEKKTYLELTSCVDKPFEEFLKQMKNQINGSL